jgi:hypothetical protein
MADKRATIARRRGLNDLKNQGFLDKTQCPRSIAVNRLKPALVRGKILYTERVVVSRTEPRPSLSARDGQRSTAWCALRSSLTGIGESAMIG